MRKSTVSGPPLIAILCFAGEALVPVGAQVPPGPKWLQTAVFYQVYPQSFFDSNGDGIGDLRGIIAKLDYIRSIGCNAVWINPIFESPFGDAGYDVADFYRVAPRYGTEQDVRDLCTEAHKRGMRVCLDLVAGHTSILNPWFQQSALRSQPNQYSNWYIWTPANEKIAGSQALSGDQYRPERYLPNFFAFQPALNYGYERPDPKEPWELPTSDAACVAVRDEIKNVMKFWLDRGADGLRVDMAASLVRNDPDHIGIKALWRYYRRWFDQEYPEAVLISEWSDPATAISAGFHIDSLLQFGDPAYTLLLGPKSLPSSGGRQPDAFFERAGGGDVRAFMDRYLKHYEASKSLGYISIPTGNHDIPRATWGRDLLEIRTILAMLLTMPGVPFIYYGDEIGMNYLPDAPNKEGGLLDGLQRCGSRTPMQWSKEKNAGFSTADPKELYLPLDPSESRPDVASQENDPGSMLNFTRSLLKLRRRHPALGNAAGFQVVYAEKYPLVYLRQAGKERIVVAINPAAKSCSIKLQEVSNLEPLLLQDTKFVDSNLTMGPVSFGIFTVLE
jgi:maltose alpha-D-glucosyltransferase / alpha-amylase